MRLIRPVMRVLALALALASVRSSADRVEVAWGEQRRSITVSNRFVLFTLGSGGAHSPQMVPGLVRLVGDYEGEGNFLGNMLASPLRTMVQFNDSILAVPCLATAAPTLTRKGGGVIVSLSFAAAKNASGVHMETIADWSVELRPNQRTLLFTATGHSAPGVVAVYHAIDFVPRSITALYAGGVTQMMNQDGWMGYRASLDPLLSLFAIGSDSGVGCVEILRGCGSFGSVGMPGARSGCCSRVICGEEAEDATYLVSTPLTSGLREILVGSGILLSG